MTQKQNAIDLAVTERVVPGIASLHDCPGHHFEMAISSRVRNLTSGFKLALLAAILGFSMTAVFAAVTGSISGTARDTQGEVLPGVTVHLRNTLTGVVRDIQTDSAGFYNFPSL
ncbi:MAG: carboxypeptidase-like regulatory domain-containing protein, partial [Acidobacteriota bacterium]